MAGPTPVSALIHAATMVTAGVYMVARCNVLFRLAPDAMLVVAVVGGFTALFAATIGLAQNDIKKVLAYSTVSQLGYMFLACGVGAFVGRHVPRHDARLLQGLPLPRVGLGDPRARREQDIRRMGGLALKIQTTYRTFLDRDARDRRACRCWPASSPKDAILAAVFEAHFPSAPAWLPRLLWIAATLHGGADGLLHVPPRSR